MRSSSLYPKNLSKSFPLITACNVDHNFPDSVVISEQDLKIGSENLYDGFRSTESPQTELGVVNCQMHDTRLVLSKLPLAEIFQNI